MFTEKERKTLSHIVDVLIGSSDEYTMEHRMYNAIVLVGIFIFFTGVITNLLMKESVVVTLSTLVWTLILIFFYITSVKYKKFLFSAIGTFASILFIFTPILWFNDGGLKGGYPYFLILFATMVVVVFRGKLKGAFLFLMVIVFLTLTFLEMKYPNLVRQCPGKNCVYYNHTWGFLMATAGVIILLNIFTNKYIEQEKDLEKLNTKLSLLSRTDPLTGLYNRRDLLEKIDYQMRISSRNKVPF